MPSRFLILKKSVFPLFIGLAAYNSILALNAKAAPLVGRPKLLMVRVLGITRAASFKSLSMKSMISSNLARGRDNSSYERLTSNPCSGIKGTGPKVLIKLQ